MNFEIKSVFACHDTELKIHLQIIDKMMLKVLYT